MSKEKKGRKIGRNKTRGQAKAYQNGMRLERNRKRRWRRTIRNQPKNQQLIDRYEAEIGPAPNEVSARALRKLGRESKLQRQQRRRTTRLLAKAAGVEGPAPE